VARVVLSRADLSLWSDPASTWLVIPHLTASAPQTTYDAATVQFDGDVLPTGFIGPTRSQTADLTALFTSGEHDQASALLDLFRVAMASPDPRLMLRRADWEVADESSFGAVVVSAWKPTPSAGMVKTVEFTATYVAYSLAVS
jgi:hypothetical protein